MVTKNTYYLVKLGSFESVFSTDDFVGYNMFWDAFSDSWLLADRESDYVDTLASLCPNENTTDALAFTKKNSHLFYWLCVAAERVYREYCDSSVDSYIAGPFTAVDLAGQLRRGGRYDLASYRRAVLGASDVAPLDAGHLATLWADGDLPAELESELEAYGVCLSEDGDSLVIK